MLGCVRLFSTAWTVARQAPLPMEFSRQEYWSGLLCSSPGNLPNPEIEPRSPALQAESLLSEPPGESKLLVAQLCPILCDSMECSLPGSSVHGILQARILEWVASHSLLLGIFPTQGLNLALSHQGSPSEERGKDIPR